MHLQSSLEVDKIWNSFKWVIIILDEVSRKYNPIKSRAGWSKLYNLPTYLWEQPGRGQCPTSPPTGDWELKEEVSAGKLNSIIVL